MGRGEAAEHTTDPAEHTRAPTAATQSAAGGTGEPADATTLLPADQFTGQADSGSPWAGNGNGQAPVSIDIGDHGPPPAA